MPHVVGVIDGKHIRIQCPKKTGTLYPSYKVSLALFCWQCVMLDTVLLFSMLVKLAAAMIAAILNNSEMGHRFQNGQMNLPDAEYLEGCNFDPLPYFFIGDEISLPPLPLRTGLMRPIPGKLSLAEQILNYRPSKARRVIENTFGCKMKIIPSSYHCVS